MIAASGILVVVAFVTLIVGVFNTGLSLIWVSIASSVLAALFLALGVMQSNKRRVAPAGGPAIASAWTEAPPATTAVMERAPAPAVAEPEEEERAPSLAAVPEPEEDMFAPGPTRARAASKPAAKPRTRSATTASDSGSVVVVPDRDKFHKETCRYAKNPAAMSMTKAAAKRQGYKACGVCKP